MKECNQCKEIKELSEFYKKSNKDGYRSKCKDCIKFQSKAWKIKNHDKVLQWRNDNKEYSKTKLKEWRIKNYVYSERVLLSESEKKIRRKEYDKKYLEKYPEKRKARNSIQLIKVADGYHKHHWSYKKENWDDFFILKSSLHSKIHSYLIYNHKNLCYETKSGLLLDTRDKHNTFIKSIKSKTYGRG